MRDVADPTGAVPPRAQGRVFKAVAKTWPWFLTGAVEGPAFELIEQERYEDAVAVLERGAERFGTRSVPAMLYAWCLHMAGRQTEAAAWAERAVEADPQSADALWLRANILFELERPEEAAAALREAVELAPDNGRFHMQLAWIQYEDGAFAATRELVEQALERSPDDAWVQHLAGRIYDHHLRHRRAQRHYERAVELDPANVLARLDLAEVLQTRGRFSAGVRVAWETAGRAGGEDADDARSLYDIVLRRWPWRWYEWALRTAVVLNVLDWILPTSRALDLVFLVAVALFYAGGWTRSLLVLPAVCRRDLVAKGRRGPFAGAVARTLVVLGGIGLVLLGELNALQHLGVLALLALGYAEWVRRAYRISQGRGRGAAPVRH
ncbi:Tetratricopeptide repeat-containing protein [Glycomyces sambucus]|uniref:Tetratricopeptide repeat-containing protein n=1 Tax=Glycomyces sambucus TaxID=380244 RepID=A0A1G9NAM4_9ACTN|nr:tetratricopeptide repeat protein [Glycomyces sambucus]SDL83177.1 Tetratricopeptide repeat-containing protein [Glycomyces sambucus]